MNLYTLAGWKSKTKCDPFSQHGKEVSKERLRVLVNWVGAWTWNKFLEGMGEIADKGVLL